MVDIRTAASTRLPGSREPRGSRGREIVRGLLALVVVMAIVVVVPLVLLQGFGAPWPDEVPAAEWIYAEFGARDVLAVLVGVVWLAWLHFVICLVVEFVAERRGRALAPHIPGGSVGTQPLARRLVGTVLLLASGMGATLPAASAVTEDTHREGRTSAVAQAAQDVGRMGTAVVDDTVAADPHRDTAAFTDEKAGVLHKYAEVQPPRGRHYDTVWGIAERYLGDGMRYKEVVALNEGMVQPNGKAWQNPDLIYPGMIFRLPADAEGPGLRVPDQEPAPRSGDGGPRKSPPEPEKDGGSQPGGGSMLDPPTGVDGSGTTVIDDASMVTIGGFSTAGALLAAGLMLNLRRRRGWDGGPNPRGGKPLDQEFDLRGSADESSAIFVDSMLRGLSSATPHGATLPPPSAALLGADGLAMTFPADSRVRLDAPWRGDPGGRTWSVRRSEAAAVTIPAGRLSPLPGLVAIGLGAHDVETMIDVESTPGVVSVSGDLEVARDIAVGLGLGLATNRWTDRPRVTFVGFADDLSSLAPDSIRHYDDLEAVFETVDAARRRQHSACAAGGFESVRAARLVDPDARMWAPEFVVLSGVPSEADVKRLQDICRDPRNAVGVVIVGDIVEAPVRLVASSEGRLWCGPLGIDVVAHRMTAESYRDALSVFDAEVATSTTSSILGDDADLAAPIVDPDSLDITRDAPVQVLTLGSVSVQAPGQVEDARRALLTEIIVYLALHPEGIHPNVLAAAIWPRGVSDDTRDSALAQAATWLGIDDNGTPRLQIAGDGTWSLSHAGIRFDWEVFRALANRSSRGSDPIGDLELALTLVRGGAWTDLPARRYGWLAYETVEADVRVAVVAVARKLASLAAEAGNPLRARNALRAGLRTAPACEEIWRDALALADTFAARADVRAVADDMYAALARDGSSRGPQAETDALVDDLLPGHRRSTAA
ncbi:MAG: hypothetical protein M3445_06505 [Actinomycetota bacterium]|nr:hypothetical protein [Actinomycetota bacterium]